MTLSSFTADDGDTLPITLNVGDERGLPLEGLARIVAEAQAVAQE